MARWRKSATSRTCRCPSHRNRSLPYCLNLGRCCRLSSAMMSVVSRPWRPSCWRQSNSARRRSINRGEEEDVPLFVGPTVERAPACHTGVSEGQGPQEGRRLAWPCQAGAAVDSRRAMPKDRAADADRVSPLRYGSVEGFIPPELGASSVGIARDPTDRHRISATLPGLSPVWRDHLR